MAAYFNEEDPSFFNSQVRSGIWLKPAAESFTSLNLTKTMRQIFYGGLVQQSWNANPTMDPVVVVVDGEDADVNPFAWKGGSNGHPETLDKSDVDASRHLDDGKTFFLVGITTCQNWKTDDGISDYVCNEDALQRLAGISALDGESSDWGSLAATDIIASTYSAYKLNGNANGYNITEGNDNKQKDSNGNKQATLHPEGVRTPGVFSIPVCDYETAYRNFVAVGGWYQGPYDKCENYPCCSCEELGMECDD